MSRGLSQRKINQQILTGISENNIQAAGPRYTPILDPTAPNLTIASLVSALEALGFTAFYKADIAARNQTLSVAWGEAPQWFKDLFNSRQYGFAELITLTTRLTRERPGRSTETLRRLRLAATTVAEIIREKERELWEQQGQTKEYSEERRSIDSQLSDLRKIQSALRHIHEFLDAPDYRLVDSNRLFIRGEWGTGKTHFLCDISRKRMELGLPTLFVLAHRLQGGIRLADSICGALSTSGGIGHVLREMNRLGRASGGRALIIVDGINEGDRPMWRRGVREFARQVAQYPHVGLVLSCRSPFEKQILTTQSERQFVMVPHRGFYDIEFDAQREFFSHYGIPTPHVPLLNPEFTRPLFLKIMCETFAGLTCAAKSKRINQIAAGQKGMTKLLEDFVSKVGQPIETDFSLRPKTCWRILKGDISPTTGALVGVTPTMAANLKDYITPREFESIVRDLTGITRITEVRRLCRRLVTEGLLAEDGTWENGAWTDIVRLPYQRFSDHLICRHLLDKHLAGVSSIGAIKRAFYSNQPLGKIFEVDQWGRSYKMPGLASAIMLEFPERVKRVAPNDRELVYYLPKKNRLIAPLIDTFLEGLLWRDFDSFSTHTDTIIKFILKREDKFVQRHALDTLICLASRPSHPYSAEWLRQFLLPMAMPERDLFWSEFLRQSYSESTLYRILGWVDGPGKSGVSGDVAENLLRLCSLFLTCTHKPLRDRATRIIVLLGENNPQQLFKTTLESFEINDPYVRERMLAASFGVLMRTWAFPSAALKASVGEFARNIYDMMFATDAVHATKHILIQDYVLGIIELGRKIDPSCLKRRPLSRLKRPFDNPGVIPDASSITEEECEPVKSAVHMDFKNYTVGSLVSGRHNHDSQHVEYRGVLRQIMWRILNLGYSADKFKDIDSSISSDSFYREQRSGEGGKTDRYGKKYSWVAYFEMCGMLADTDLLPDHSHSPRVAEADIDPSFTVRQPDWTPPLRSVFTAPFVSAREWAENGPTPSYDHLLHMNEVDSNTGPWILLNGFVSEEAPDVTDPRKIFTFIRGLLVDRADIPELIKRIEEIKYPGNHEVPEPAEDHYTYAGEIPWSRSYGWPRPKSGVAKPTLRRALQIGFQKKVRVRFDKLNWFEQANYLGLPTVRFRTILDDIVAGDELPDLPQRLEEERAAEAATEAEARAKVPKYVTIERHHTIPGIEAEVPMHRYSWESHHSTENHAGGVDYVAPALCDQLALRNRGNSMDLYDEHGNLASLYRMFGNQEFWRSDLLYLRKDLLEKYLAATGKEIVWIIWGERDFKHKQLDRYRSEIQDIWSAYKHIHRANVVGIPPVS